MSNDSARHEFEDVLALVQEQMADLAEIRQKQAALTASAAVADGTVEVTVDVRGTVVKTVIDAAYLEDFEFADLGSYATAAAQAAAREVGRRAAELLAPLQERRAMMPSLSDIVDDAPDVRSLLDQLIPASAAQAAPAEDSDGGWDEQPQFPTLRR